MIKRFWPFIALLTGVLVVAGVYFFVIKGKTTTGTTTQEDQTVAELPNDQKPYASLTPSQDGHWLKMKIEGIKVKGAVSIDYELLYKVSDGRTQGVPGSVKLNGQTSIERNLLLGSESSGKFRYDVGVEMGTLTLRFRDGSGKLLGKLSTDWKLTQVGSNFTVTMDTFASGTKTFTSSPAFPDGKSTTKTVAPVPND